LSALPDGVAHFPLDWQTRLTVAKYKNCGILWGMGNKDARRREVKKPKKKAPKPEPNRPAITFVNKPSTPS
jgi:hypothetical protein